MASLKWNRLKNYLLKANNKKLWSRFTEKKKAPRFFAGTKKVDGNCNLEGNKKHLWKNAMEKSNIMPAVWTEMWTC